MLAYCGKMVPSGSSEKVYVPTADGYITCGSDFVVPVEKLDAPESVDKYIISTMAKFEPLQSPRAQGGTADAAWFAGLTAADYGRMKKEILHTDHAKLREFAKLLRKFASEGAVCVVGHEAALQKCSDLELKEL